MWTKCQIRVPLPILHGSSTYALSWICTPGNRSACDNFIDLRSGAHLGDAAQIKIFLPSSQVNTLLIAYIADRSAWETGNLYGILNSLSVAPRNGNNSAPST